MLCSFTCGNCGKLYVGDQGERLGIEGLLLVNLYIAIICIDLCGIRPLLQALNTCNFFATMSVFNKTQTSAFDTGMCLISPLACVRFGLFSAMGCASRVPLNGRLSRRHLKLKGSRPNVRGGDWPDQLTRSKWIEKLQKCIRASVRHITPYRGQSASPCRERQFISAYKKARGLWALCVNRAVHNHQLISFRGMGGDLADAIAGIFPALACEHEINYLSFYCATELPTHPVEQSDVDILGVADL